MENCECGVERKKFWLWLDSNGGAHASRFQPSLGAVRTVRAATARDALLTMTGTLAPKHQVSDVDDPSTVWEGRCSVASAVAS